MAVSMYSSHNSYKTLITLSREGCDFCDRTFKNRFQSIVHNASHIIIPLIKQNIYQCEECLYYFTSQDDLYYHLKTKHVNTAVNNQETNKKYILKIKFEKPDNEFDIDQESHEHTIERLKDESRSFKNIEIKPANEANSYLSGPVKTEDTDSDSENELENHCNNSSNSEIECIKSRLKFEDEGLSSIHYSNLTKPGVYVCRYCSTSFPNRLLLIQHEPIHIHIRKPQPMLCTFCDVYIAGRRVQLRRHIEREHPGASLDKKYKTYKCQKCGLKFRKYISHVIKYHPNDCHGCGKEFRQVTELNTHVQHCKVQNVSKILNVCDLCFCFMKVKMNLKYTLMGYTLNEPGVRYPCSMCGKKYFQLKTIKRILYGTNGFGSRRYKKKEIKPMSNEERLKKFQHRLKKINLLNKF